jgi:hypothetical protein
MPSILLCLSVTQAPNPANIRPLHILEQTLVHIKNKWKSEEKPYPWICDQLKSMRQDLTVSRISPWPTLTNRWLNKQGRTGAKDQERVYGQGIRIPCSGGFAIRKCRPPILFQNTYRSFGLIWLT